MKASELLDSFHEVDSHVLKLFSSRKYKRVRNAYLAYRVARPFYDKIHAERLALAGFKPFTYRVEYKSVAHTYLSMWFLKHIPPVEQDFFNVSVREVLVSNEEKVKRERSFGEVLDSYGDNSGTSEPSTGTEDKEDVYKSVPYYDFAVEQPKSFMFNGQKITLEPDALEDENNPHAAGNRPTSRTAKRKNSHWSDYILSARGIEGKAAIEALLAEAVAEATSDESTDTPVHVGTVYGGTRWVDRGLIPPRSFDNVFLSNDIQEALVADVGRFLSMKSNYERLGIPYHRGYLLYGEPGTGKTSVVQAIANHFRLHLMCVSLKEIKSDSILSDLFHDAWRKSIILIEDIDSVQVTNDGSTSQEGKDGISLAGLLNVLDGVSFAKGQIVFMTTNHPERLDHRLLRPGRCDFKAHIGLLSEEQYYGFFRLFFEQDPLLPWAEFNFEGVSPAELTECFKRHPMDINAANEYLIQHYAHGADRTKVDDLQLRHGIDALA